MFSPGRLNAPHAVLRGHTCRPWLPRGCQLPYRIRTFVRSLPTSSTSNDRPTKQPAVDLRLKAAQSGLSRPHLHTLSDGSDLMYALQEIIGTARPTPTDVTPTSAAHTSQSDTTSVSSGAEVLALPPFPEAPKYPCPYLSDEEIATYLVPLYSRGWFVGSSEYDRKDQMFPSKNASPVLNKLIVLPENQPEYASQLAIELKNIQSKEDHHCTTDTSGHMVRISTHTHSARPLSEPGSTSQPRKRPGITLRDIRLAILIEEALQRHTQHNVADEPSPGQQPDAFPRTMEQVENLRFLREV